jgi:hypothetical protein
MNALAERTERTEDSFSGSMRRGTQVLATPFLASDFVYLSVPRTAGVNEPSVAFILDENDSWGATTLRLLLWGGLTRTQGPVPDQFRLYVSPVAERLGRSVQHPGLSVTEAVRKLKERTGLPASEVAHMLGVRRRQLYRIEETGSTTPEREVRLRAINDVVDDLYARFGDPAIVRSCFLAPVGQDLQSFVDIAGSGDVLSAREALFSYLERRGARGVPEYIERPSKSARRQQDVSELARSTSDIAPDRR